MAVVVVGDCLDGAYDAAAMLRCGPRELADRSGYGSRQDGCVGMQQRVGERERRTTMEQSRAQQRRLICMSGASMVTGQ